jgi:hypothetical protein
MTGENPAGTPQNSYAERLLKLIPAEVTTAYVAVAAALNDATVDPRVLSVALMVWTTMLPLFVG